jgi:hypothetical protein
LLRRPSQRSLPSKAGEARTIVELLETAKVKTDAGENSLRAAAEDLAAAELLGATQRQMASALGKSPAWISRILAWRRGGYATETPFGPQSKASRQRAISVQSTDRGTHEKRSRPERDADHKSATTNHTADQGEADAQARNVKVPATVVDPLEIPPALLRRDFSPPERLQAENLQRAWDYACPLVQERFVAKIKALRGAAIVAGAIGDWSKPCDGICTKKWRYRNRWVAGVKA